MLETDRTALICDLAETYGVYDMEALPVDTLAALAVGLREDSRIVMKMTGQAISLTQMLLAGILDGINLLCWLNSEDGRKGRNRPTSVVSTFQGEKKKEPGVYKQYSSGEEFLKDRKKLLAEVTNG